MKEGKLPNYQRLAEMGCYHRLATTYPSVSPVAWSSFSTGTPPPKHNIYDFLTKHDQQCLIGLLYIGTEEIPASQINEKILQVFDRLMSELEKELNKTE